MSRILMVAYTNYRRDPRVKREAESLVAIGHEVTFLASRQPAEPNREAVAGVDVIKLLGLRRKPSNFLEYMFDYLTFFAQVNLHLLRQPRYYDLIHVNNMPDFLAFAAWLPRLMGRPLIHDIHDLMPELYAEKFAAGDRHWVVRLLAAQERWAGRFATAVLTVEDRLRDILSQRGIPPSRIHVLMNLPDDRLFAPRPPQRTKDDDEPFVVVYHGTLAHRLGLDIAIRAIHRLRSRIPHLQLRIIGAGEERVSLMDLRTELDLSDVVTFSDGFVAVEQIQALISDADVGLIPLRISSGTDIMLPTKLLEYVLVGIPCVTPRTRTIARYFDDEMVEYFEAENVDSLADALYRLYADPSRRRHLAEQATERFARKYRWSEHKSVYTDLIESLLPSSDRSNCTTSPANPADRSSSREDRPMPK